MMQEAHEEAKATLMAAKAKNRDGQKTKTRREQRELSTAINSMYMMKLTKETQRQKRLWEK
jgi:hypothetical protein